MSTCASLVDRRDDRGFIARGKRRCDRPAEFLMAGAPVCDSHALRVLRQLVKGGAVRVESAQ